MVQREGVKADRVKTTCEESHGKRLNIAGDPTTLQTRVRYCCRASNAFLIIGFLEHGRSVALHSGTISLFEMLIYALTAEREKCSSPSAS